MSMVYRRISETKHLYGGSGTCQGDRSTIQREIRLCHCDRLSPRHEMYWNFMFAELYITWSSDFALYSWLYQIDKHHTLGTCSVSHYE